MFQPASPLTVANAKSLYQEGLSAIRGGQTSIDLGGLQAVDSSAVAALVGWQRAAVLQGTSLTFTNLSANLQSLAALYGVAELVQSPSGPASARTDLPHH